MNILRIFWISSTSYKQSRECYQWTSILAKLTFVRCLAHLWIPYDRSGRNSDNTRWCTRWSRTRIQELCYISGNKKINSRFYYCIMFTDLQSISHDQELRMNQTTPPGPKVVVNYIHEKKSTNAKSMPCQI